jgi:hypothetical protein
MRQTSESVSMDSAEGADAAKAMCCSIFKADGPPLHPGE